MTTYTTMFKINDYFKFKVPLLESDTGDELFKVKCIYIDANGIKYTLEKFIKGSHYTEIRTYDEKWITFDNVIPISSTEFEEIVNDYLSIFAV